RLVKGFNAGREFKTITPDAYNRVVVRKPRGDEAAQLLASAAESGVLDSVSAEMTLSKLALVQTTIGDEQAAAKTRSRLTKVGAGREAGEERSAPDLACRGLVERAGGEL